MPGLGDGAGDTGERTELLRCKLLGQLGEGDDI